MENYVSKDNINKDSSRKKCKYKLRKIVGKKKVISRINIIKKYLDKQQYVFTISRNKNSPNFTFNIHCYSRKHQKFIIEFSKTRKKYAFIMAKIFRKLKVLFPQNLQKNDISYNDINSRFDKLCL